MNERTSPKKRNVAARLIGGTMMASLLVLGGVIFFNSISGGSNPNIANPVTGAAPVPVDTPADGKTDTAKPPKYSFYKQLQTRSQEVQKEIDHRLAVQEKAPPIKGRNFRVQVGAFRNPDQAERMQQLMLLRKLPVRVIRNGEFHLVQVGPYGSRGQAEKIQKTLEDDGVKTIIKTFVDN